MCLSKTPVHVSLGFCHKRYRHDQQLMLGTFPNSMQTYTQWSKHCQLHCNENCNVIENWRIWWFIGRYDAFRPKGCGFESLSSRYVGNLGKSFTRSCLWRFGVKL